MNEQVKAIISTIASLVVVGAGMFGLTIDEGTAVTIVSAAVIVAIVVWDIWKNHNFTVAAQLGQQVLDAVKKDVLSKEDVEKFIDEHVAK